MPNKIIIENREIRVFLSSTFKDMQAERNYLMKHVFPEVREACTARKVGFTEIDLRWGITEEESKNGVTVAICLSEIDRCRDYPPFFIGFLGERYGWIPKRDELLGSLEQEHINKYEGAIEKSLDDNISVTELELRYGVLESTHDKVKALFYLRDKKLTEKLYQHDGKPDIGDYYDSGDGKLDDLKKVMRSSSFFVLDHDYRTVAEFGESIKNSLLQSLEKRYPLKETLSPYEARVNAHATFAQSRRQHYIQIPSVQQTILKYCQSRLDHRRKESRPYLIQGESGLGKSALIADLAIYLDQEIKGALIVDRYVGADGQRDINEWCDDLLTQFSDNLEESEKKPKSNKERWESLIRCLSKVVESRKGKPIVLLLDGINQLVKPNDALRELQNLYWPKGIILIMSSTPEIAANSALCIVETLQKPLPAERRAIITSYTKNFRKSLTDNQIELICHSTVAGLPLYLRIVLEALRARATHSNLDQYIHRLLSHINVKSLFEQILNEWDEDYSDKRHPALASRTAGLLTLAREGLTENALGQLLASQTDIEIGDIKPVFARQYLSQLMAVLRPYLLRNAGREQLMHSALNAAALDRVDEVMLRRQLIEHNSSGDAAALTECVFQHTMLCESGKTDIESEKEALVKLLSEPTYVVICFKKAPTVLQQAFVVLGASERKAVKEIAILMMKWSRSGRFQPQFKLIVWLTNLNFINLANVWALGLLTHLKKNYSNGHPYQIEGLSIVAKLELANNRLAEAEALFELVLHAYRKALPAMHTDLAKGLINLASVYQAQNRLTEAQPLLKEALIIYRTVFPEGHHNIATVLNNLASLYHAQNRPTEALPLFEKALLARRESLPEGHPDIAICLMNLASVYQAQNRLTEAQPLLEEALLISRNALPEGHPDIATGLNKLASVYQAQNRLAEALPLFEEALVISRISLPVGHPDLAIGLNNLASVYQAQNRLTEAQPLLEEALLIYRNALPESHPNIATGLNNLAVYHYSQNRLAEALPLFEESLLISRKSLPDGHPDIATRLNNLAELYRAQNRLTDTEPLLEEALLISRKALPNGHPNIAVGLNNLANVYREQNRLTEAQPLLEEALLIFRKGLPEGHPNIATGLNNLAQLYQEQNRLTKAQPLLEEALLIFRKALPEGHPDIATGLKNLASVHYAQNRLAEAKPLLEETLSIHRKTLPDGHPDIVSVINKLALIHTASANKRH